MYLQWLILVIFLSLKPHLTKTLNSRNFSFLLTHRKLTSFTFACERNSVWRLCFGFQCVCVCLCVCVWACVCVDTTGRQVLVNNLPSNHFLSVLKVSLLFTFLCFLQSSPINKDLTLQCFLFHKISFSPHLNKQSNWRHYLETSWKEVFFSFQVNLFFYSMINLPYSLL